MPVMLLRVFWGIIQERSHVPTTAPRDSTPSGR